MWEDSPLVTVGLPVRDARDRVRAVVESVLAQDYPNLELVISDNASTDGTEQVCRELARADPRVRYHRQPENVGLLNNFLTAMRLARGELFRWIGDDDRLEPSCVSRCVAVFQSDPRLVLVTTQVAYLEEDAGDAGDAGAGGAGGAPPVPQTMAYHRTELKSDDPVVRLTEMLRLLTQSYLVLDPLYGLMRRSVITGIPRRNMLCEDEIFAAKLALAGPWGHVPEVLAHRHWKTAGFARTGRRLGVPGWQMRMPLLLEARELMRWLPHSGLAADQRRQARAAIARFYLRARRRALARRARWVARTARRGVSARA